MEMIVSLDKNNSGFIYHADLYSVLFRFGIWKVPFISS